MIVRDSARTLDACLGSIQPWVDELIVVDTGSTDNTPAIAANYGACVFSFPWQEDFSAARNQSLRHATGEWLFWMDSDDTIDATNGRKLRALADGSLESAPLGYVMQVRCPGQASDGTTDFTVVDHVKMFRNRAELRFEGRIHEQILMAIRRANGEVAWTDIFVTHSGSDQSAVGRVRKYARDLRLLELELAEKPGNSFTLFNLGMTYGDMGEHARAIEYLEKCLRAAAVGESHVRKAFALLAHSQAGVGEFSQSWKTCQQGRRLFPKDSELLFREGIALHRLGRPAEAIACYRALLGQTDDRHFSSVDSSITGYKARFNLALTYGEVGRLDLAELQWRLVIAEIPTSRVARRALGELLIRQRRLVTAEIEAEGMLEAPSLASEGRLLLAAIGKSRGDIEETRRQLNAARDLSPEDLAVLQACGEFFFHHGDPLETEQVLLELCDREPADGSVFHNLGSFYCRLGDPEKAIVAYRRSLELRPAHEATNVELNQLLARERSLSETNGAFVSL